MKLIKIKTKKEKYMNLKKHGFFITSFLSLIAFQKNMHHFSLVDQAVAADRNTADKAAVVAEDAAKDAQEKVAEIADDVAEHGKKAHKKLSKKSAAAKREADEKVRIAKSKKRKALNQDTVGDQLSDHFEHAKKKVVDVKDEATE